MYEAGFIAGQTRPPGMDPFPEKLNQVADFIRNNWQKRWPNLLKNPRPGIISYPMTAEEIEAFIRLKCYKFEK